MSTLAWQTFLLLLGAFLIGASLGCLVRRALRSRARHTAGPHPLPAEAPRINALVSRFEQALSGAGAGAPPLQDLTRIRAIDRVQQAKLHAMGVRSYLDIARWTRQDVERVSTALGASGRIEQERWVEQAQILCLGKETYYARRMARGGLRMPRSSPPAAATPMPQTAPVLPLAAPAARPAPPASAPAPQQTAAPLAAALAAISRVAAAARAAEQGTRRADQLTRIRGIDANLESHLNALGVSRYTEIARWTPQDVSRFAAALGVSGRIEQEDWIAQAGILGTGGETFYSSRKAKPVFS